MRRSRPVWRSARSATAASRSRASPSTSAPPSSSTTPGASLDPDSSAPLAGEYVVGWIKRGPSGVIGTNKRDAQETVDAMIADLSAPSGGGGAQRAAHLPSSPDAASIEALLRSRQPALVTYAGLGDDRPSRASSRRGCRPAAGQAHADRGASARGRLRRAIDARALCERVPPTGKLVCQTVRPQAPLAHLVERRTFNPVGRVRVPHGALARDAPKRATVSRWHQ